TGYDQAILVRMAQGKKDLTGPSGRERILRLVETLADQGALTTLEDANGLLMAAALPPLFDGQPAEARLITRLARAPAQHRIRKTNLPASLTTLIGRTREIADLRDLLGQTRLLSLTGSGGAGKTRLAQRLAADVLIHYRDGVWYAELASLSDAALIPVTLAHLFGLTSADRPSFEQLADFLRERQALLVLDNCEHLIDGAADVAKRLLTECAELTLLTTSREALNIDGEMTWRVPPMQIDEASVLFVERAHLAQPGRALSAGDKTVAHVCRRLDGMPLAIELAAARLNAISLSDIAARLDDRFTLLSSGRRGALPRHQTLRALIDWSHDLLSEAEQAVFRRLSVFMGGWSLEEARAVSELDPLPVLTQLVAKSLVVMEESDGHTRYRFLETIRQYALEKLAAQGEVERAQRLHAEALARLAEQAWPFLHHREQMRWIKRLRLEQPNLRAALDWSLGSGGDPLLGCRLVGMLGEYWNVAATHSREEVQRWVRLATEVVSSDMPTDAQAWVWLAADNVLEVVSPYSQRALTLFEESGNRTGALIAKYFVARSHAYSTLDFAGTIRMHEEDVAQSRVFGEGWILYHNLGGLAEALRFSQEFARADRAYQEAYQLALNAGDLQYACMTLLYHISGSAKERLQFEESLRFDQQGLEMARALENDSLEMTARCHIGQDILYLGDVPRAVALLEDCLAFARERTSGHNLVNAHAHLARATLAAGDYVRAQGLLDEAVRLAMSFGSRSNYFEFDAMATVAAAQGDPVRCARLRGLVSRLMDERHQYRLAHLEWAFAPYIAKARAAIGDKAFEAAYAEGRAMPLDEAIAYALRA
ncbi:MAG: AAA family ATPase, partial [Thermoflexales bacterium]